MMMKEKVLQDEFLNSIQLPWQLTYFYWQDKNIKFTTTSSCSDPQDSDERQCVRRIVFELDHVILITDMFLLTRHHNQIHNNLFVFKSVEQFFIIFCCVLQQMNLTCLFYKFLYVVHQIKCQCILDHKFFLGYTSRFVLRPTKYMF